MRDLAELAAALAKVQAELPKLERDRTVTVEHKDGSSHSYSYVTLANLSENILPLLAKHGLSFAGLPGTGADGKMCLRYYLLHESGEHLSGEFPISGEGGIQMVGGRITYARRYCLAALVGVAADEDDEARLSDDGAPRAAAVDTQKKTRASARAASAGSPRGAQPPQQPGAKVGQDQHRHMHALWRELGYDGEDNRDNRLAIIAKILNLTDLASSADLTRAQADTVIAALRERKRLSQRDPGEPS